MVSIINYLISITVVLKLSKQDLRRVEMISDIWKPSIAKSIMLTFLAVIVPTIILSFLAIDSGIRIVKNEVIASASNYTGMLLDHFDRNLENYEALAYAFGVDGEVNYLNSFLNVDDDMIWRYVNLIEHLNLLSKASDFDANVVIFLGNRQRLLHSNGIMDIKNLYPVNGHAFADKKNGKWVLSDDPIIGEEQVLTFTFSRDFNGNNDNVVVVVEISLSGVKRILRNFGVFRGGSVYLIDSKGNPIYVDRPSGFDLIGLSSLVVSSVEKTNHLEFLSFNEKYWVTFQKSGKTGMTLGMYFPEYQIVQPIYEIRNWLKIFLIASTCLTVFFTMITYKNVLSPVGILIEAMRKVSKGDFNVRILENERNEFGFLFTQFNRMISKINSLITDVYVEKSKSQDAQLKYLQSQINPHFLYNCLYTVYHLISSDKPTGAADMVMYLGEYFRYSTRSNKDLVRFEEELENVNFYIKLQQMRYINRFIYYQEIEDDVRQLIIPRLVLQPIIENAIIHGIEKSANYGEVKVIAAKEKSNLVITVTDSGEGIKEEKLNEIRKGMNDMSYDDDDDAAAGSGLINTHWRLRLRYGIDAGLSINTVEPKGTVVTLTIPYKKDDIDV